MDFEWVALALDDLSWIVLAFALGFTAKLFNLPPLVGFLATGFVLNYFGVTSSETLQKLADLGITLLFFTIGLKINVKEFLRPQIWSVTLIHSSTSIIIFSLIIYVLTLLSIPLFSNLETNSIFILAFALSFSSTVFVVKTLESKTEMRSLHGRIAIGILVIQDIAAVIFLAATTGKLPSIWAFLLLGLIPMRFMLFYLLKKSGHGELLILYGFVLALGSAELFELSGIKGDLGAIVLGALLAYTTKASEISKITEFSKVMLGFKDLFLVGFFLTVGMSGNFSADAFILGLLLVPLILLKSSLFFGLLTLHKLRARSAVLASLNLSNYSEFGLIVIAIGVSKGWMDPEWLTVMAIAISFSFILASQLNKVDNNIYSKYRKFWMRFQRKERLFDDMPINTQEASIIIFGMGRVGSGAYDAMCERHGNTIVGIDFDSYRVQVHQSKGRNVLHGDPSDADFWEKIERDNNIQVVMLALPNLQTNLDALDQLKQVTFTGYIAATARFPDEVVVLKEAGVNAVFNIYTEAGAGFATHLEKSISIK